MVLSYYLLKIPYTLVWEARNLLGLNKDVMLYCANTLDYQIFAPIQKHLPKLKVIAKDKRAQLALKEIGVESVLYPVFPKAVIMCRTAGYKFPASRMIKVGMRHGAYAFKPFANPKGSNLLNYFYMASKREVERARKIGVKSGMAIGYPKLDPFFDGSITETQLTELRHQAAIDPKKPTLLFTATWNDSGISAVQRWYDKLEKLTKNYNILVTVHLWTDEAIKQRIEATKRVYFIRSMDVVPYIQIADVCIGDTSSILGECCALNKPIITFKVNDGKRTVPEVKQMISEFSAQIDTFEQLENEIVYALKNPDARLEARQQANQIMFDTLDGKAGLRAAEHLKSILPELNQSADSSNAQIS